MINFELLADIVMQVITNTIIHEATHGLFSIDSFSDQSLANALGKNIERIFRLIKDDDPYWLVHEGFFSNIIENYNATAVHPVYTATMEFDTDSILFIASSDEIKFMECVADYICADRFSEEDETIAFLKNNADPWALAVTTVDAARHAQWPCYCDKKLNKAAEDLLDKLTKPLV